MNDEQEICRGDQVLARCWEEGWLLDGELLRWSMATESGLVMAEIDVQPHTARLLRPLRLKFVDIVELGFYYNNEITFYTIEDCKFLRTSTGFYLSLDPDTSSRVPLKTDQDFLLAKYVVSSWIG